MRGPAPPRHARHWQGQGPRTTFSMRLEMARRLATLQCHASKLPCTDMPVNNFSGLGHEAGAQALQALREAQEAAIQTPIPDCISSELGIQA
ncbi:hypothetical protein CBOM_07532 [Ceraceosorus bombacis]|uniref:Uncharacterized protein n=1 Tax=Ceraceosorus bombacis TaxID=401625 RepID=A0A0P1BED8_9BASI|nr:hypothetical protein CBOM_07532 [Ceraceosorus bombacis]